MKFDELLDTLLYCGLSIELSFDSKLGCNVYDLNIHLKSRMILHVKDGVIYCSQRYDRVNIINSIEDLVDIHKYWFRVSSRDHELTLCKSWENVYKLA